MTTDANRVALVGYGAMGKEIERIASLHNATIISVHDLDSPLQEDHAAAVDVVIDFTHADAVMQTVNTCCNAGTNLVIGTTGWQANFSKVHELAVAHNIGVIYGSNFSLGVNLFLGVVERAAQLFNNHSEFDVFLHEWHHKRKRDSPSGTALTIADALLQHIERKTQINVETQHNTIAPSDLHVTSTRGGEVVGTHRVQFDGPHDVITLEHFAKDRTGFAAGALYAASIVNSVKGLTNFYEAVVGKE